MNMNYNKDILKPTESISIACCNRHNKPAQFWLHISVGEVLMTYWNWSWLQDSLNKWVE